MNGNCVRTERRETDGALWFVRHLRTPRMPSPQIFLNYILSKTRGKCKRIFARRAAVRACAAAPLLPPPCAGAFALSDTRRTLPIQPPFLHAAARAVTARGGRIFRTERFNFLHRHAPRRHPENAAAAPKMRRMCNFYTKFEKKKMIFCTEMTVKLCTPS